MKHFKPAAGKRDRVPSADSVSVGQQRPGPKPVPAVLCAAAAVLSAALWGLVLGQTPPRDDFIRTDPDKVVLAEACGECHRSALSVWKTTPHASGFDELHAKESAQEIAKAMGFFLIKRESLCIKCHYTPVIRRDRLWAGAGVTCESCHGAAKDWINVHNVYGVRESDFQKARLLETPQHEARRLAQADAAGMLRPSNLYAVASNCFQCHTVPHEKLVNVGRHATGSAGFELLSWTQGELRHNFLESYLSGDGTVNAQRAAPRRRMLYLMGRVLDLEYSLRGLSAATQDGRYFKAMKRRYRSALGEVRAIASQIELAELEEMLSAVQGLIPKPGQEAPLLQAAEKVGDAGLRLGQARDGTRLAALDPFLSGEGAPPLEVDVDEPAETAAAVPPSAGSEADPSPGGGAADATSPAASAGGGASAGASPDPPASSGASEARGEVSGASSADATPGRRRPTVSQVGRLLTRPPWRPQPSHRSIGPAECGGCHDHSEHDEWWLDDEHYLTADRILEESRQALQIARFYGLSSRQMKRGDQICMQCHGSILSGRESRPVISGVGCESCHGSGADFKEPHQKSREQGLQLGMIDLKDLPTRAQTCAGCHYINEPRLISAGHPTGSDFDLGQRNEKIRHWEHALADAGALRTAYRQVISQRGAIPSVARVQDLEVPLADAQDAPGRSAASQALSVAGSPSSPSAVGSGTTRPSTVPSATVPSASAPPATTPSAAASSAGGASDAGPADASLPASDARRTAADAQASHQALAAQGRSLAETLLRIKQRLEELYRQSRPARPPQE